MRRLTAIAIVLASCSAEPHPTRRSGSLTIGTEQEVSDENVVSGSRTGCLGHPEIATDGTIYLATWIDCSDGSLFAMRLDSAGMPMDPGGLRLGNAPSSADAGVVAYDGLNFVAVAFDWEAGEARIIRIDPAGSVVGVTPLTPAPPGSGAFFVGSNGDGSLVGWHQPDGVRAVRVAQDGTILDAVPILVTPDPAWRIVAVASDGADYLLAWSDSTSILGARITGGGVGLDATPLVLAMSTSSVVDVAYGAGHYHLAWTHGADVLGLRVAADGTALDAAPSVLYTASDPGNQPRAASIAWSGTEFAVAWSGRIFPTTFPLEACLVDAAGSAGPPVTIEAAPMYDDGVPSTSQPGLAFGPAGFLIAWRTSTFPGPGPEPVRWIDGRVLATDGSLPGSSLHVSQRYNIHDAPIVASLPSGSLVAWLDSRAVPPALYAHTPGASDVPIPSGGDPIQILGGAPRLVSSATQYLIAWRQSPFLFPPDPGAPVEVRASRLAADGSPLDGSGIVLAPNGTGVTVASDGTDFLAAWNANTGLAWRRIASDGSLGPVASIPGGLPALGFGTDRYLLAWMSFAGLELRLLDTAGAVIGAGSVPGVSAVGAPAVSFGDGRFLVVWETVDGVSATLVDPTGATAAPFVVATNSWGVAVAFDGFRHVVVWRDYSGGATHLRTTTVTTDGVVEDVAGLLVGSPTVYAADFALAAGPAPGTALLVYESRASHGGQRNFERVLVDEPPPAPDAGLPDTGIPDAGASDAQTAGEPDAASDASSDPAGCGCRASPRSTGRGGLLALIAFIAVGAASQRRRSKSPLLLVR